MRNTLCSDSVTLSVEDHPHIHGEYYMGKTLFKIQIGSPPHTWGIQCQRYCMHLCARITPTYMGNTNRACVWSSLLRGSPPHTWGILITSYLTSKSVGITPTYMGNTNRACVWSSLLRGSPPHTWGILRGLSR